MLSLPLLKFITSIAVALYLHPRQNSSAQAGWLNVTHQKPQDPTLIMM